jgi:hypothetical protein
VQITLAKNELEFNILIDKSDKHILTPLDLGLNLEKCAYIDDINLPAMRVFGELPLINLALTDSKLVQVLKILVSIGNNDNVQCENEHHFYDDDDNNNSVQLLSSSGSEQDLQEALKNLSIITPNVKTEQPAGTIPLQNINIEFAFEIKDIILSIS